VKHILVVGHYGCGGVLAAMSNNSFGFLDNWLVNIKNVYGKYQDQLDLIRDEHERGNRLVELNVIEQVRNLAKISFIQEEWKEGNFPELHGLVYGIADGKLIDLDVSTNSSSDIRPVFRFAQENPKD
jgi:carbonic anhydrase